MESELGSIDIQGGETRFENLKFNVLAHNNSKQLLMLGLVADATEIKAIRAILGGALGKGTRIRAAGKVTKKNTEEWWESGEKPIGDVSLLDNGYMTYTHKLEYGQVHALFVTKHPGFMNVVSDETLWRQLNDPAFTTPILREWMPYIEKKLRAERLLNNAWCFGCDCGFIEATTSSLDQIVENGLKNFEITIPRKVKTLEPATTAEV